MWWILAVLSGQRDDKVLAVLPQTSRWREFREQRDGHLLGDARRRTREVEYQLNAVRRRMWELREQTRAIRGRVFVLEMDERPKREWVLLRWRYLLGRHATWEPDIEPEIVEFPEALQAWYRSVNTEMLMLNVQERCLRYERRALKKLLEGPRG